MKKHALLLTILWFSLLHTYAQNISILIEAESFNDKGGWVIDQQFMDVMGSPFLMAHGLGSPVDNASTKVSISTPGKYYLFVRTRNWNAEWTDIDAAGKFQIALDDKSINKIFGAGTKDWTWSEGGTVELSKKTYKLSLKDLTGFNGRCDAIILSTDPDFTPPNETEKLAKFRREKLGLSEKPESAGNFDFVVVGGGISKKRLRVLVLHDAANNSEKRIRATIVALILW